MLSKEEYEKSEEAQRKHRIVNSLLSVCVVVLGFFFVKGQVTPLYEEVSGIKEAKIEREEIEQIMNDESLRTCQYKDSLGNATIGVGHLVRAEEGLPRCISTHKAIDLLVLDYRKAKADVERRYPWAEGEVKLVLTNLTFQLGSAGLAKFEKTLYYLEVGDYKKASGELLDSVAYKQAPNRLIRHAARILSLGV